MTRNNVQLVSPRLPGRTPAATAPVVLLASSLPPGASALTVLLGHSRQPLAPGHQPCAPTVALASPRLPGPTTKATAPTVLLANSRRLCWWVPHHGLYPRVEIVLLAHLLRPGPLRAQYAPRIRTRRLGARRYLPARARQATRVQTAAIAALAGRSSTVKDQRRPAHRSHAPAHVHALHPPGRHRARFLTGQGHTVTTKIAIGSLPRLEPWKSPFRFHLLTQNRHMTP